MYNIYVALSPVFFLKFVMELWGLIDIRISFPLKILRINEYISPIFLYAFILARPRLGSLPVIFHKRVTEFLPLIDIFTA